MTAKINTFEGQSSGTTLTAANSGGGSGDALDSVAGTGTITGTFDNGQAAHGTQSLRLNGSATSTWLNKWTSPNSLTLATRAYLRLNAAVGTAQDIVQIRNSTVQAAAVGFSATNQIQIKDATGATAKNFLALSLNTWYRLEIQYTVGGSTTTGVTNAQYYLLDSRVPVETVYQSGATMNLGTTNLTEFRWGKLLSAPALDVYWDDVAWNDDSANPIGPFQVNTPMTDNIQAIRRAAFW